MFTLTPEIFSAVVGCPVGISKAWAGPIEAAMIEYGILSRLRAAMFLARMGTESGGFQNFTESLNYSTKALLSNFGRHRISVAQAEQYGRNDAHPANQEALANILYGGAWGLANLGNVEDGDGWRFRGQGPKQITGRYNFGKATSTLRERLGPHVPDFVENPSLLTQPTWGAFSAGSYWDTHNLNVPADAGDVEECVRLINGGQMGLDDTKWRYEHALEVLE